jgi:hypothetical protein
MQWSSQACCSEINVTLCIRRKSCTLTVSQTEYMICEERSCKRLGKELKHDCLMAHLPVLIADSIGNYYVWQLF